MCKLAAGVRGPPCCVWSFSFLPNNLLNVLTCLSAWIFPLVSWNHKSRLPFWFSFFFVLPSSFLWKSLLLVSFNTLQFPSSLSSWRLVSFGRLSRSQREKWERETLSVTNQAFDSNGIMRQRPNSKVMEGWRQTGLWTGSYTEAATLVCCWRTTGNRENNNSPCGLLTAPLYDASCCVSEKENVVRQHSGGRRPAEAVLDHSRTAL